MLFLKFYAPESFLAFSAISLLLFDTFIINFLKFKTPIFYQIGTLFLLLLFILSNVSFV